MSGFSSITQSALNGVNNVKGQSRILESEIRMDASRGVVIKRKEEKLEMLKTQEEAAMNFLTNAMEQDAENTKKFIDSVEETNNKIREEAEKNQEEKAAEESKTKNNTEGNQNTAVDSQNTAETGGVVDIVIPSTIVSSDLSSDKNKDEQTDVSVDVSA